VFYILFISPLVRYIASFVTGKPYTYTFAWHTGPLWFVETLLIFSLIYLIFRKDNLRIARNRFPTNQTILLFILAIAALTFIVRIWSPIGLWVHVFQPAYFVHYIVLFYIGTLAYKNNWFEHLTEKISRLWKIIAVCSIICYPLIYGIIIEGLGYGIDDIFGGFAWPSLALCIIESFAMVSIIISLLLIYKKRFDHQKKLGRWMSPNFYGAYIFHMIFIYGLVVILWGVQIPSILKFLIVVLIAVPASFALTALVRLVPGVKRVLG
jgi:hypothetical protein